MEDLKYLEFLAVDSKEIIEKQVDFTGSNIPMQGQLLVQPLCLFRFF
ncbi:MAG: hypothetical protein ABI685_03885 [Ferruginibacter sp.]